jgi:hypothetical protein
MSIASMRNIGRTKVHYAHLLIGGVELAAKVAKKYETTS